MDQPLVAQRRKVSWDADKPIWNEADDFLLSLAVSTMEGKRIRVQNVVNQMNALGVRRYTYAMIYRRATDRFAHLLPSPRTYKKKRPCKGVSTIRSRPSDKELDEVVSRYAMSLSPNPAFEVESSATARELDEIVSCYASSQTKVNPTPQPNR